VKEVETTKRIECTDWKSNKRSENSRALYTSAACRKADVSIPFLSDVEQGVVGISTETFAKICSTLQISADWLLKGGETMILHTDVAKKLDGLPPEYLKTIDEIIDRLLLLISDNK